MKYIALPVILFLSTFLTSCNDCDSGIDCCNPETSKLYISSYLTDWFPYNPADSIVITSQDSGQLIFIVDNLIEKDTGYFQGDECPDRPGEFKSGELVSQNDTLVFTSGRANNFVVEVDQIKFIIGDYPVGKQVNSFNQTTTVKMMDSANLVTTGFQDLIVAQSDSGEIQKLYLSRGLGLVGIQRNDIIYELK